MNLLPPAPLEAKSVARTRRPKVDVAEHRFVENGLAASTSPPFAQQAHFELDSVAVGIFPGAVDSPAQVEVKLGVILGSVLSAVVGAAVLSVASRRLRPPTGSGSSSTEP